ncbi:hypothetical protein, partial [Nocardia mangyaensis]|uniref:hypothetical protein n=1 Tax=Nocardia mangyaensis TaxID=2213200 RepID=UPI0026768E4A
MEIKDGTGTGNRLKVNSNNRALTDSISRSVEHNANYEGDSYSLPIQQTPTGASDYFFYFKNNGDRYVIFEGFDYRVASAESINVILNPSVSTLSGNTSATPVNLNTSSSTTLISTVEAGNDITGISGGNT